MSHVIPSEYQNLKKNRCHLGPGAVMERNETICKTEINMKNIRNSFDGDAQWKCFNWLFRLSIHSFGTFAFRIWVCRPSTMTMAWVVWWNAVTIYLILSIEWVNKLSSRMARHAIVIVIIINPGKFNRVRLSICFLIIRFHSTSCYAMKNPF